MTEHEPHSIPNTEQLHDHEVPGGAGPTAENKVNGFLYANEELYEVINELWEDVDQARNDFIQTCNVPRRIVGDEVVGGRRVVTLQTPRSTNPNDWPSGTKPFDPFKAITEHADIARKYVESFDWLRAMAHEATFRRADVGFVLEMVDADMAKLRAIHEEPPVEQVEGAGIEEYSIAFNAVGDSFIAAGAAQRLGIHKVEQLLEDTSVVVPFLDRVGAIALASQEGEAEYPGLLETIAAETAQARIQQKKSLLQAALQRVLQERKAAGSGAEATVAQTTLTSASEPLAVWKTVRQLLKGFEHHDRIFKPETPSEVSSRRDLLRGFDRPGRQ